MQERKRCGSWNITVPAFTLVERGPSSGRKHEENNVNIAENGEFSSFLHNAMPSLGESDLPAASALQFLNFELNPSHYKGRREEWVGIPGIQTRRVGKSIENAVGQLREAAVKNNRRKSGWIEEGRRIEGEMGY